MQNKLSFEPEYHELWVRPTEPYWSAIADPRYPEVIAERAKIEAEGGKVSWDAQHQINKFRMVASVPYCLAVIGILSEALQLAAKWPLGWQVLTGVAATGLVLAVSLIGSCIVNRQYPRKG